MKSNGMWNLQHRKTDLLQQNLWLVRSKGSHDQKVCSNIPQAAMLFQLSLISVASLNTPHCKPIAKLRHYTHFALDGIHIGDAFSHITVGLLTAVMNVDSASELSTSHAKFLHENDSQTMNRSTAINVTIIDDNRKSRDAFRMLTRDLFYYKMSTRKTMIVVYTNIQVHTVYILNIS